VTNAVLANAEHAAFNNGKFAPMVNTSSIHSAIFHPTPVLNVVGDIVGAFDGDVDGVFVFVGDLDGAFDGAFDGDFDFVGDFDGAFDGAAVGFGEIVGALLGAFDGAVVGFGEIVGANDSAALLHVAASIQT